MLNEQLNELALNAANASTLLKAMGNTNRLMILCAISHQTLCVSELNKIVPLSQSALSQHLAALRRAQLVVTKRKSQTIYYSIDGDAPLKIIATLKDIYCPDNAPK